MKNKYSKYSIMFILGLITASILMKPRVEFINCTEDTQEEILSIMEDMK